MKKYFRYTMMALAAVALLSSCDENAWNDDLDGFQKPGLGTGEKALTYTLTAADYAKISTGKIYKAYAEEHEQTDMLATIGSTCSFVSDEAARPYLQMFLRDSTNNFYTLAGGSAVKLTYNVDTNVPDEVKSINKGVRQYALTEDDYIDAWGDDEDYIEAFAPATPASRFIPNMLKGLYPKAETGDFAVVSYAEAQENPIFGSVGGGNEKPAFEPTSVLGTAAEGTNVTVKGYITAVCTRGFILTDNTGSVLCYGGSSFDASSVAVGNQVTVNGDISSYGTGIQIAVSDNYTIEGTGAYTYPAPTVYTGAMMDEAVTRTTNEYAKYVQFTGKAAVGSYINFTVDGAATSQGSAYYCPEDVKAQLVDGEEYTIVGYFSSVSSSRYFNVIITQVLPANTAAAPRRAAAVDPVTVNKNGIYRFNGTKWEVPTGTIVLQPADYTAMGQSYGNLSGSLPAELLPIFLRTNYPYAQADDVKTIAYLYYGGGTTAYRAAQYTYNGSDWTINTGEATSQFVSKDGYWFYNPSVVITLPYSRNTDPSYTYYMACVNWVFDNIGKEMGGTSLTDSPFIDYRGNAEFYSGASAYYGNVDCRSVTARNNAPTGYTLYDDMTDDEVVLLVQKRFCLETMPGALSMLHPDAMPVDGMEVTYTINFTAYEQGGVAREQVLVYTVSGPGQFKYKSCTWFQNGEDADW